jgi:hypothetical protein
VLDLATTQKTNGNNQQSNTNVFDPRVAGFFNVDGELVEVISSKRVTTGCGVHDDSSRCFFEAP